MTIVLNHTIAPAQDKAAAAQWFAKIFGLGVDQTDSHFAAVKINDDLTFLFAEEKSFGRNHYAFHVSDSEFDAIVGRVQAEGVAFGSAPWSERDRKFNDWNGGRGVYFRSPDGHLLELMTVAH